MKPGKYKETKVVYETHGNLNYLNFSTSLNVRELMLPPRCK